MIPTTGNSGGNRKGASGVVGGNSHQIAQLKQGAITQRFPLETVAQIHLRRVFDIGVYRQIAKGQQFGGFRQFYGDGMQINAGDQAVDDFRLRLRAVGQFR